jgi:hypothetical protein
MLLCESYLSNVITSAFAVDEVCLSSEPTVDGSWSPWSTLDTPCVNVATGRLATCGGGVQMRYRSCSEPMPRCGGRVCDGDSQKQDPCNIDSCQRKTNSFH